MRGKAWEPVFLKLLLPLHNMEVVRGVEMEVQCWAQERMRTLESERDREQER